MNRRAFLTTAALGAAPMVAQQPRDWTGKVPTRYPEPDVVVLDAAKRDSSLCDTKTFVEWAKNNSTIRL